MVKPTLPKFTSFAFALLMGFASFAEASESGTLACRAQKSLKAGKIAKSYSQLERALLASRKEADLGAVERGGLQHLRLADTLDLLHVPDDVRPRVAARRQDDVDVVPLVPVLEQRPADAVLDVIRMRADREDVQLPRRRFRRACAAYQEGRKNRKYRLTVHVISP